MNAPPLLLGGKSPVVAYLRHSIIVLGFVSKSLLLSFKKQTVFPEPLYPTISVNGV